MTPVHHTGRDEHALRTAGIDPATTQPREGRVPCLHGRCRRSTLHQAGRCDDHYLPPAAVRRAQLNGGA